MANKISTIIDFSTDQAKSGLASFKTAINDAEGATGKFKAGVSNLGTTLGNFLSGPGGVAVVGGAIGAAGKYAFDAASQFSALGVEVGKVSDATGLANEDASRWIEVADDIGIPADTLEASIGKMNKTLGATPGVFEAAKVEIAHTKDGAVDVNKTFLNLIDRLKGIKDPADRAALAQKTLGKGWQQMAELIQQGSGTLSKSLSEVSDAKVFDEEEVAKAREFRAAMDKINDITQEFAITIGEEVVPAISEMAGVLEKVASLWGSTFGLAKDNVLKAKEAVLNLTDTQGDLTEETKATAAQVAETDRETRKLADGFGEVQDEEAAASAAALEYKRNADNTARAVKQNIDEMIGKWAELRGEVEDDRSWLTVQGQFDQVRTKFEEANTAIKDGTDDAAEKTRDYALALDDLTLGMIDYAEKVLKLPPEKVVNIKAALDQGDIDRAEAMLAILTRNRNINLDLILKGAPGYGDLSGARASGGPVSAGGAYVVGEQGPEVLQMGSQSGTIIPNGGGGDTFVINPPVGFNDRDLMRALQKLKARNGPAFLAS